MAQPSLLTYGLIALGIYGFQKGWFAGLLGNKANPPSAPALSDPVDTGNAPYPKQPEQPAENVPYQPPPAPMPELPAIPVQPITGNVLAITETLIRDLAGGPALTVVASYQGAAHTYRVDVQAIPESLGMNGPAIAVESKLITLGPYATSTRVDIEAMAPRQGVPSGNYYIRWAIVDAERNIPVMVGQNRYLRRIG